MKICKSFIQKKLIVFTSPFGIGIVGSSFYKYDLSADLLDDARGRPGHETKETCVASGFSPWLSASPKEHRCLTKQIQPTRFRCVISNFSGDARLYASPEFCVKRAPDLRRWGDATPRNLHGCSVRTLRTVALSKFSRKATFCSLYQMLRRPNVPPVAESRQ